MHGKIKKILLKMYFFSKGQTWINFDNLKKPLSINNQAEDARTCMGRKI